MRLTRLQLAGVAVVTVVWGLNWPVMKLGVTEYPPFSFRTLSMWLGLPVLWSIIRAMQVPLAIPRAHWREVAVLTFTNMIVWHTLVMVAVPLLSSGRAAILGYTMPVFSAVWGMALFGQRLAGRQWLGLGAAAGGVVLLLWHELGVMAGRPLGVAGMLVAAAVWALGTQQMRRSAVPAPTLAIIWWMTLASTLWLSLLALVFEHDRWSEPGGGAWFAILYNAVLIFGTVQPVWLLLARQLPPIASTLSVMLIPVIGIASGALWLGEPLHWQDFAAMALMLAAIASVLRPPKLATAQA
jgi:drug/metabolite transporter (DMT)-like permease